MPSATHIAVTGSKVAIVSEGEIVSTGEVVKYMSAFATAPNNLRALGVVALPGPANSLEIGTVSEGPAAATLTGTAPNQVLNLVVPNGNTGATGPNSVSTSTTTTLNGTLIGNGSTVAVSKVTITEPATGATVTIADGKTLTVVNNASIAGTNSGDDKTGVYGLMHGNGTSISVAPTGTARLVDTLFDYTLTATDLPTWTVSADAGTDVVTFTGHTPTNGEAYYIEGGTPPTFGDAVNRAFSSEIIGPVVYAVNSSGSTCKMAATKGGTALDITNAGSGWTLRLAGLDSVNITGISIASGTTFQATMESSYGWGWATGAVATCGLRINGDTGSRYKFSGTEATQWLFDVGNLYAYAAYELRNIGRAVAGKHNSIGLYGTSGLNADSAIGHNTPGSVMYAADAALTISSMMFYRPSSATTVGYQFKLGTRFMIRKIG